MNELRGKKMNLFSKLLFSTFSIYTILASFCLKFHITKTKYTLVGPFKQFKLFCFPLRQDLMTLLRLTQTSASFYLSPVSGWDYR